MRREKTVILILIISFLSVSGFLGYIKLKKYSHEFIHDYLREYIKGGLSIGQIKFTLKRIHLNNVVITDTASDESDPFLSAGSVTAAISYKSILKRQFSISNIEFNEITINLKKEKNRWNFKDNILLPVDSQKKKSLRIPAEEIEIRNLNINIMTVEGKKRKTYTFSNTFAGMNYENEKYYMFINGGFNESKFKIRTIIYNNKTDSDTKNKIHIIVEEFSLHKNDNSFFAEKIKGNMEVINKDLRIRNIKGYAKAGNLIIPFSNLNADIFFKPGYIDFRNLNLLIYNGMLKGNGIFSADRFYTAEFNFVNIDISSLIKHYRVSDKEINGKLALDLKIGARKKNGWSPKIIGFVHAINIRMPDIKSIDVLNIDWEYERNMYFMKDINISTSSRKFFGKGYISGNGKLNLYFTTEAKKNILDRLPVFGYFTYELRNVDLRVSGTLQKPVFEIAFAEKIPGILFGSVLNVIRLIFLPITRTFEYVTKK